MTVATAVVEAACRALLAGDLDQHLAYIAPAVYLTSARPRVHFARGQLAMNAAQRVRGLEPYRTFMALFAAAQRPPAPPIHAQCMGPPDPTGAQWVQADLFGREPASGRPYHWWLIAQVDAAERITRLTLHWRGPLKGYRLPA